MAGEMVCVLQRCSIHTVIIPQIAFMSGATGRSHSQKFPPLWRHIRKARLHHPFEYTRNIYVFINVMSESISGCGDSQKRALHALGRQARAKHLRWAEYWMWSLQFKAYFELWGCVPDMREQRGAKDTLYPSTLSLHNYTNTARDGLFKWGEISK